MTNLTEPDMPFNRAAAARNVVWSFTRCAREARRREAEKIRMVQPRLHDVRLPFPDGPAEGCEAAGRGGKPGHAERQQRNAAGLDLITVDATRRERHDGLRKDLPIQGAQQ